MQCGSASVEERVREPVKERERERENESVLALDAFPLHDHGGLWRTHQDEGGACGGDAKGESRIYILA